MPRANSDFRGWLESLPRFSTLKYNLFRSYVLLKQFVPGFRDSKVFFITGSKGKGTTAHYLAAILGRAGVRAGLVTSPHLVDICERVQLAGQAIPGPVLEGYLEQIYRRLPELPATYGTWIHSEVLLTAAMMWFADSGAEAVVLEAGLGGRLDAGNILPKVATCITTVSLEHREILGPTVADIAREKAGIISPRVPVVTAAGQGAEAVIEARARLLAAPLYRLGREFNWQGGELALPRNRVGMPVPPLAAQRTNKALAACLAEMWPGVTGDHIAAGLAEPGLPGRFEVRAGQPPVVLDVAHTPEAVANLLSGLDQFFPGARVVFVVGFLQDKPVRQMVAALAARGRVLLTAVDDVRGYVPGPLPGAEVVESTWAGLERARQGADVICVTGSFAVVRQAKLLLSKP